MITRISVIGIAPPRMLAKEASIIMQNSTPLAPMIVASGNRNHMIAAPAIAVSSTAKKTFALPKRSSAAGPTTSMTMMLPVQVVRLVFPSTCSTARG